MKRPLLISPLLAVLLTIPSPAQKMPRADVVEFPAEQEGVHFHHLFQSNMVLQRDHPIGLWGWADPNEALTITLDGAAVQTQAAADGRWEASFPARPADASPIVITAKGSGDEVRLENVLIGDVWVLGGQSNMEFELNKVVNGKLEIVSANFPDIRILTIPYGEGPEHRQNFARLHQWSDWSKRHFRKGDWDVCTPEIAKELSAIGYAFARRIHMASQVPIGVIDTSRGGTTVETWTPEAVLRSMEQEPVTRLLADWDKKVADYDPEKSLQDKIESHRAYVARMEKQGKAIPADRTEPTEPAPSPIENHNYPGSCYAGMIAPLEGLRVSGAIFHQGFNNCFSGSEGVRMYREVFPAMIAAWRKAFQDPDMPFGIISLCTAGDAQTLDNYSEMSRDTGAYIRDAQFRTFLELYRAGDKNIGFTSSYDLRRRWYHPQVKIPAGERIARWALATQYGQDKDLLWKPAMIEDMSAAGGQIALSFDSNIAAEDSGHPIYGFSIAGADRKFHPAITTHRVTGKDARGRDQRDMKTLILTSPLVPEPQHFRYAWARNPLANVQNQHNSDIPLPTQRSDDWPVEAVPLLKAEDGGAGEPPSSRAIQEALRREDLRRRLHEARELIEAHGTP